MEGSTEQDQGTARAWLRCYRCWSTNLEVQVHYEGVHRIDAPHHGGAERHRGVEVTAAHRAQGDDQPEEHDPVYQADHGEVRAGLRTRTGGDVQHNHRANREGEYQRADQLGDVGGESSILH